MIIFVFNIISLIDVSIIWLFNLGEGILIASTHTNDLLGELIMLLLRGIFSLRRFLDVRFILCLSIYFLM